jgi:pSer/pThr/pTyr-binding forkhead associated (FHA) protein
MKARLISLDYHVPQCDTSVNGSPVVIGHAADVDIRLEDDSIAEHHCRIVADGDHWIVSDLGTVHGTRVNRSRITQSVLRPGDELSVGAMTFLVEAAPANG